jgi:chorismate--pyruvate lyase
MISSASFRPTRSATVPHSGYPAPDWQYLADAEPLVRDWLFDPGSLTRRLTLLSDDHFSVRVLLQDWQPLRDEECLALGVPVGSEGWVREVCLLGHGQSWVFARSVAARSSLQASDLDLQALGNRSLGELLFCDPAFVRGPIQTCRYPARWLPAQHAGEQFWARRSRFDRGPLAVLVAEVFLPPVWQAVRNQMERR